MKKNALKIGALALCSVLFALSCEKKEVIVENEVEEINDEVEAPEVAQPEKVYRTFTFEFPSDPDSKVSLAADGKTAWEAGDQIMIHGSHVGNSGETYYSRVVTLSAGDISVDGQTATFTLEDINPKPDNWRASGYGATMFAAYPASALAAYNNGDKWYYTSPFSATNNLLLAGTNNVTADEEYTFRFKILCGALSFVISEGDYDSYVFAGKGGDEVVGYDVFSCRIDTQTTFGDKNVIPYDGGSGGIGTSGPHTTVSGAMAANGTPNYIFFPGGVNLSSGFEIKFLKGGDIVKTLSTSTAKNIAIGKYLNLGDVTSHLKTYTPPSSHNATTPAIAGATDLGASGTANCYIVDGSDAGNENKVFKFRAVKGNSATNVGTISSVEVLWETWNNDASVTENSVIAAVDYDKQPANDYYEICFQMPETLHAGNAVIAAKNSGGDILWSWHIWVPSSSIDDVDASTICGATIMDRNLGALEKVSTSTGVTVYNFGLMYQWGRKDPFPGPKRVEQWVNPATVSGTAPTLNNASMTMADAIAHPTVYGNVSEGDWQTTTDQTRWLKDSKTINDPCPPGYRIPYGLRASSAGTLPLWNDASTTGIQTAVEAAGLGWEVSTTGYWVKINDGDKEVVFPLGGYVDDSVTDHYQISNARIRAGIWALSDSSSSKYHLDFRTDGPRYKFGSTAASRGCYVRCVAE